MKKILYALTGLLLLASYTTRAQAILNNSFETWATRNGVEAPVGWLTSDDYVHALLLNQGYDVYFPTNTVTKTTVSHSGTYAASLVTKSLTISSKPFPGLIILGSKLTPLYLGGTAYTSRPTQVQFSYQFTGPAADSASALIYLTNTVGGKTNLVGGIELYLPPTTGTSYSQVSLPLNYSSSTTPDSIRVAFFSGLATTITVGSTLLVDDIAFSGAPLAVRADAGTQELLTVAPNPSPGGRFVINSPGRPELAGAPLQVLDGLGRTVVQQAAQAMPNGQRELDLSSLSTGIYLLRLDSKQGTIVRQLTVK